MNCETCQLKELELDPTEIRDVLRCVVHTIFFHRALGLVRPKDVDCELFEITYVQCGDAELEKKIDEKLEHFVAWSEKHPNRKSQVCLSFYEVKSKQSSWFGSKVERHYWEQWIVNVNVHPINPPRSSFLNSREKVSEETSTRRSALETSVREILFQIIKFANEKQEHIPPITNTEVVSFPYEISTPR
ncbi:autophagy-related protein 101-like isoform X2 [Carex rostrata]